VKFSPRNKTGGADDRNCGTIVLWEMVDPVALIEAGLCPVAFHAVTSKQIVVDGLRGLRVNTVTTPPVETAVIEAPQVPRW
jgi:hypothetical protein